MGCVFAGSCGVVYVDEVVMGADCQLGTSIIVPHDLDPLLWVIHLAYDVVHLNCLLRFQPFDHANRNTSIVVADSQMLELLAIGEGPGLAMWVLVAHGAGTTSLRLRFEGFDVFDSGDASFTNTLLGARTV